MREYQAQSRRQSLGMAIRYNNPPPRWLFLEGLGVSRVRNILIVLGLGILILEDPAVRSGLERLFTASSETRVANDPRLQATNADELDYLRSFVPEFQAPNHIDDLQTLRDTLIKRPNNLPIAKSDAHALMAATTTCIRYLKKSLPQGGESMLTASMLYESQLQACASDIDKRSRKFMKKLGLLEPPNQLPQPASGRIAQWLKH